MSTLLHFLGWLFSFALIVGFVLYVFKPLTDDIRERLSEKKSRKNSKSKLEDTTFFTDSDGSFHTSFHFKKEAR